MSSTYSQSLRIELIGAGDQAGTWGSTTNNSFAYVLDTAIAGYQTVSVVAANQALTYVNGAYSNGLLNESVYAILRLTTSTGANFNVYAPPAPKIYIIFNDSAYTATIYNSTVIGNTTAAGDGATIPASGKVMVWSNGTSFYALQSETLTGTLGIAKGGTGQTTQQAAINALTGTQVANRVLRSDGTNVTLSQVALTTDVSGTLPVASGGTGTTTSTGTDNVVLSNSPTLTTPTLTSARVPGTSTGYTTVASANTGATNFTATLPAENFAVGFRNVPPVGAKSSSYTLTANDAGKYVQITTGGSIVIPNGVFAEGDAVSLFNNTSGTITITCSALTTYLAGLNTAKTSLTLSIRGVATILFISGSTCVVSGLVS